MIVANNDYYDCQKYVKCFMNIKTKKYKYFVGTDENRVL